MLRVGCALARWSKLLSDEERTEVGVERPRGTERRDSDRLAERLPNLVGGTDDESADRFHDA